MLVPEPRPFLRVGERQAHATRAGQETPQFLAQFPGEKNPRIPDRSAR
jgi:hypothetical protein